MVFASIFMFLKLLLFFASIWLSCQIAQSTIQFINCGLNRSEALQDLTCFFKLEFVSPNGFSFDRVSQTLHTLLSWSNESAQISVVTISSQQFLFSQVCVSHLLIHQTFYENLETFHPCHSMQGAVVLKKALRASSSITSFLLSRVVCWSSVTNEVQWHVPALYQPSPTRHVKKVPFLTHLASYSLKGHRVIETHSVETFPSIQLSHNDHHVISMLVPSAYIWRASL